MAAGEGRTQATPAVGTRVLLFGKHRATVRYVGPVEGQRGQWVGIEYDDPQAGGKHDGCHAGRRYFQCAHPTVGSLVRLPKFAEAASYGRSLTAAAAERYGSSSMDGSSGGSGSRSGVGGHDQQAVGSEDGQAGQQQQLFLATAGKRKVAVELVTKPPGATGSSSRRQSAGGGAGSGLIASLVAHAVSSVGDAAELRAMLPALTELDLSDNLIASWAFVAELAAALPALHILNLSGNRLALPPLASGGPAACTPVSPQAVRPPGGSSPQLDSLAAASLGPPAASLAGLQTLVLNNCSVSWAQAVAVVQHLPSLRELHLCSNGLASLALPAGTAGAAGAAGAADKGLDAGAPPASGAAAASNPDDTGALLAAAFGRLELLDLENNELSSWDDVATLGALPTLRSLLLSGNWLAAVRYTGGFSTLRSLLLGSNRLDSWAAVDELGRFPALEEARLSDNPVTAAAPSSARYQCIARVSRLTTLNASGVSPAERWDAEVNYLRLVTDELAGAGADEAARSRVLAANPRFEALTRKYGELAPAAPKAAAGSALASSMAQLTICHNGKELQKKLPVSLTVGRLKLMLERLLRVKAAQQALLLVPPADSGSQPEDITDEESRELRYFDACDGYRLEVRTSDPAARAAALAEAKAAAAAAHAQRMEQHEKAIQQFRAVEQRLMA